MGIVAYSLLWAMQDLYHQPYPLQAKQPSTTLDPQVLLKRMMSTISTVRNSEPRSLGRPQLLLHVLKPQSPNPSPKTANEDSWLLVAGLARAVAEKTKRSSSVVQEDLRSAPLRSVGHLPKPQDPYEKS